MSTNVGEIDLALVLNSVKFNNQLKNVDNQANKASSTISNSLSKIGVAVAAAFSVVAVVNFGKECLKVATETSNAWIGLNSILTGQGKSFEQAEGFIQNYIADGLIPLTNAVTAYKNLSLRGYNSEQIQKTMTALKNSAVFGRQSMYTLGQAVQTASEGLKNGNSILVDNAGVTKNVAKMWEDYAKSIGKTTNQLTKQEQIQAEFLGIQEETKFQMNDASIATQTYSGTVAVLNTAFTNMKTAIGNIIQPLAKALAPALTTAMNAVTKLFTAFSSLLALFGFKTDLEVAYDAIDNLAGGASGASEAIGGIGDSAKQTAKDLKKTIAGFDEINKLEDNSDSSSGGGNSGAGGGSTGVVAKTTNNSSATEFEMPNWMKDFDFSNLISAFNNLKSAVAPIIETVGEALIWFYNEILVPLAKWTIKDAVPAFINMLAGAFKLLNPILKAFVNAGKWLLENFLIPIAKWTGGVIVSVLNGMGQAMSKLGDSISNSKTAMAVLEGIAKAVLAIGTAYTIMNLEMKAGLAIQGFIVPIITSITTAYKVATGQIILMGTSTKATSALVSAFGIITQLLTGKITLATAAQALWSVATTAFNAILAANPIGVAIIAITALTAAIIAVISWTKKATEAEKEAAAATKERLDKTNELYDAFKSNQEQHQQKVASDLADINNAQRLSGELKLLADEQGNVSEKDKARAQFILGELNNALGTEYTMINNQIQGYKDLYTEIDRQIEQKKIQILLEAEEANYKEALINLTKTETERTKAKQEVEEALAAFEAKENKENAQRYLDASERYDKLDEMSKTYNQNIRIYETATAEMLQGNNKDAINLLQTREKALKTYEKTLDVSADEQNKILQEQYTKSVEDLDIYKDKYLKGVQGFTKDGLLEATNYAMKAKEEYSKVGGDSVQGYIDGINSKKQNMWSSLGDIFREGTNTAKNELDSHSPSRVFKNIGNDTIQGYIDGANGKQNSLTSAMRSLFDGAIATARKVLDSHSPSRVFESIGEDTTDGYIGGLENNFKLVSDSVANMFSEATDVASGAEIAFGTDPILKFTNAMEKGISIFEKFKTALVEVGNIAKNSLSINLPQIAPEQFVRANTPQIALASSSNSNGFIGSDNKIIDMIKSAANTVNQKDSNSETYPDGDIIINNILDGELIQRRQFKRRDMLALATNGRVNL